MPKKQAAKKPMPDFNYTPRAKDLPATQGMLQLVRSELKSDIRELRSEMKTGFSQVDARFERVMSELSRVALLVEEQNANNRVVLEGLTGLWQRQERVETRFDGVEELVRAIARTRS